MKPANLVIEIQNGQVVAVTSTSPDVSYIVFNHDTRNQNISPYLPDLYLKPEDMSKHINDLLSAQPEKPQEHIKSIIFFQEGSVEATFMLPNGEKISVYLPSDAMKGKSIADRYSIMLERINRHRQCSQDNMNQ